ncbi:BlaI/MecI/CopY family transcriptional regulator [bacterium]|nr:MAG: BlaI/MecI/CopY family transcriptional regulator [bacterium]
MPSVDDGSQPKPTNAELGILRVLWDRGPSTVRETHETLARKRDIGYTTVLKLMQIMTDKGLLRRKEQGRAHVYQPAGNEATAKRDLVGDLMDRAFGGSARELVMHALEAKPASTEELAAIRRMLDEMEAERG